MFLTRTIPTISSQYPRNDTAVHFSAGADTYMTTSINGTETDSTYVFWCKSNVGTSAQGHILGHGNDINGSVEIKPETTPDKVKIILGGKSATFSSAPIAIPGTGWHHYILSVDVSDTSTTKLWIDGEAMTLLLSDNVGDPSSWGDLIIGAEHTSILSRNGYTGNVSDFAVYEQLFTEKEAATVWLGGDINRPFDHSKAPHEMRRNLIAWYQFGDGDERGSGTTIYDMSGNGNNALMRRSVPAAADDMYVMVSNDSTVKTAG